MPPKIHRSKISRGEWILVIIALGFVDLLQIILDMLVGVGVIVNRFLDIFVGAALILYLSVRGEFRNPDIRKRLILAFIATFIIEQIPFGDVAPCWVLDGIYCRKQSLQTHKIADAQDTEEAEIKKVERITIQQNKLNQLELIRKQQYIQAAQAARARQAQAEYEEKERAIGKRSNQEEYDSLMNR